MNKTLKKNTVPGMRQVSRIYRMNEDISGKQMTDYIVKDRIEEDLGVENS